MIDEAMIPFKGCLGFKQYMRDKPVKWGIKVWVLADATNGYVKKFEVTTGKEEGFACSMGLYVMFQICVELDGRTSR